MQMSHAHANECRRCVIFDTDARVPASPREVSPQMQKSLTPSSTTLCTLLLTVTDKLLATYFTSKLGHFSICIYNLPSVGDHMPLKSIFRHKCCLTFSTRELFVPTVSLDMVLQLPSTDEILLAEVTLQHFRFW